MSDFSCLFVLKDKIIDLKDREIVIAVVTPYEDNNRSPRFLKVS